jgi:hypothetical protein
MKCIRKKDLKRAELETLNLGTQSVRPVHLKEKHLFEDPKGLPLKSRKKASKKGENC